MGEEGAEAEAGGGMAAGAEGAAGVEEDDGFAGLGLVILPGGCDDESGSDAHDLEVGLPCVGPGGAGEGAEADGAGADAQALFLEGGEPSAHGANAFLGIVVRREVGDDAHGERTALLGDAAGAQGEQDVCEPLGRFGVSKDSYFSEVAWV